MFKSILLVLIFFIISPPVFAETTAAGNHVATAQETKEILEFQLTEDVLTRFAAASKQIHDNAPPPTTTDYSPAGLAAVIESSPIRMNIVKEYGFAPRQFAITFTVLTSAVITVLAAEAHEPGASEGLVASKANIAFYKSHRMKIDEFMGNGQSPE